MVRYKRYKCLRCGHEQMAMSTRHRDPKVVRASYYESVAKHCTPENHALWGKTMYYCRYCKRKIA